MKNKKYRDKHKLFIVEGIRLLEEVIRADWKIEAVFHLNGRNKDKRWQNVYRMLQERCNKFNLLSENEFAKKFQGSKAEYTRIG